jgi:hypothetical protein
MDEILSKPINIQIFIDILNEIIEFQFIQWNI